MSLRSRPPEPLPHPAVAWSETVHALAEAHRLRREVELSIRWPLAHACTHRRGAASTSSSDAVVDVKDGDEPGSFRHAFCCRALA
jgi:hypothetical protein